MIGGSTRYPRSASKARMKLHARRRRGYLKRREHFCRAVSSLQVPRPSQHRVGIVDFGLFCGAGSLRTLFKKSPTTNLLPQSASVALPADYAVSLNIRCMGADVIVADFIVGECLGCNRVSSTSLSTFPSDLHLAWGPLPRISQDRLRGQCVSATGGTVTPGTLFRKTICTISCSRLRTTIMT